MWIGGLPIFSQEELIHRFTASGDLQTWPRWTFRMKASLPISSFLFFTRARQICRPFVECYGVLSGKRVLIGAQPVHEDEPLLPESARGLAGLRCAGNAPILLPAAVAYVHC